LLGFPYNFDGLMFDFKPSIIELYKQKSIKQRDYYFEGGKKLILNEVPPSRMKKNKFI
jgi:hypothetical protein